MNLVCAKLIRSLTMMMIDGKEEDFYRISKTLTVCTGRNMIALLTLSSRLKILLIFAKSLLRAQPSRQRLTILSVVGL
jgi:hypothetical protein